MKQRPIKKPSQALVVFLLIALAIGLGMGLLITRVIRPPGGINAAFSQLDPDAREEYAILVASAYGQDRDLAQAQAQLEQLGLPNVQLWLASLVDQRLADDPDSADTRALVTLAHSMGVKSRPVLAYLATLTPRPTQTPLPTWTPAPTLTPSPTPVPPTKEPTAVEPTATTTQAPTDTPPLPTDTPAPQPTQTPQPQPTQTPRPQPTATPKPTNPPAVKWSYTATLVGPGVDGQSCAEGHKMIRVTVLDAAGQQIPGLWVHEKYTGVFQVTGHKGDDPFWGPGEVEFSNLDGGQVCIASGQGGACESEFTRNLPCHDPPPFEDLWAAGYCDCREAGITKEQCRELYDSGQWQPISHYYWRVEFRRSG